jgi:hypothetical protein
VGIFLVRAFYSSCAGLTRASHSVRRDGRIKSGHDDKEMSWIPAFAGMTIEGHVMRGLDPRICRWHEADEESAIHKCK